MTQTAIVFLVISGALSILNWVAVSRNNVILEYVSKPSATLSFLLTALTLDVPHSASWTWRCIGLVFCIAGDVFLMLPKDAFIPGLVSFAIAQILFAVSFLASDVTSSRLVGGVLVVGLVSLFLANRFVKGIKRTGLHALVMPVIAYMFVISAMTIGAFGTGSYIAIAAATIFMASDSLIAESRFVQARSWHPVGIMATYHVALAGLVLSL